MPAYLLRFEIIEIRGYGTIATTARGEHTYEHAVESVGNFRSEIASLDATKILKDFITDSVREPIDFRVRTNSQTYQTRADRFACGHRSDTADVVAQVNFATVGAEPDSKLVMMAIVHAQREARLFALSPWLKINLSGDLAVKILLPSPDKDRRGFRIVKSGRRSFKPQPARSLRQRPSRGLKVAHEIP